MEIFVFLGVAIIGFQLVNMWYLIRLKDHVDYLRKMTVKSHGTLLRGIGTTQSRLKAQKRSDPYPSRPRPKAEQHYENQGVPRQGSSTAEVTKSGTPVRIGKIKRKLAGGSTGDSPNTRLPEDPGSV